jgi:3-methyl-2-oxobutanoate hydroxymethyltransferase
MADAPARKKVTINTLMAKMKKGEPITQLAAYDYRTAVVADRLGMDILCVSDTGGMILFGHKSTVSVSFDEVMMMSKAIDRGSKYGLRMVDMPYWSFHVSPEQAVENAGRFVHEANAEVMKCEGNKYHARNIEAIVRAGIPVQGHIGITPMRMPQLGGFVAQGKTARRAKDMVEDAKAMVDAGCFSILCEVTTSEVAEYLAQTLPVPVISLGAGNRAHGVHMIPIMEDVISRYMSDVVNRAYPAEKETVFMNADECLAFAQEMKWERKVDELRSATKKTA